MYVYIYICIYIFIWDVHLHNWDAIHISMHSQRYDTYEAASDTFHPCYDAISISIQFDLIQCDSMQWKKILILFLWLRQTANHKLTCVFWLLTPRGPFHKKRLISVILTCCQMIWFHNSNVTKINLSHCGYLCWKANLVQGRLSWAPLTLTNRNANITTDSLTYYHSHAAFLSGFLTAVPFIVRTDSIRTLQSNIALKALTMTKS